MGFSFPPHPAELVKVSASLERVNSSVQERDPHVLPDFDSKSLTKSTSPVLYLPPLLSSLPHTLPPAIIVQSDYPPLVTETRLPDIDPASLSLHKALHHFHPVTSLYAETDYADAFNWSELELPENEERDWYCVVFRSKRKADSDGGPLYDADKKAHEEAVLNGGLIMYWYGAPDPNSGMNLATCIWQSRKHAIAANSRPHHLRAMKLAAASYEIYTLERYKLQKLQGEKGVSIQPFEGGEVGW
ncbi:hypothetical protein SERLA73DRAFT_53138 [Serpula lacrymans var. lacrymans S7.3]|uniref:Uncharacterized protein n=2 Tax=Serpula lacrymans var. lacrymans TaxID=341189 RepID=F8PW91_SERL3|nr:uncharacterized protein SERLADRAFT_348669 [Serpula lacrymans var. lacrymans S7.9]EGO00267.1 hypothetical protein SERLA73DRAFT_53138 [Serpula lacrymans var. lacrymans S7.3]EGO25822.1 hypothetical protein SERLADRAFT_348669 [Serpula lacrymans var. lacrymans S7.9]